MPEVIEVYRMAGDVDYMLRVVAPDMQAYDFFYKRLIAVVPLKNVTTRFAMERVKSTTALPLALATIPLHGMGNAYPAATTVENDLLPEKRPTAPACYAQSFFKKNILVDLRGSRADDSGMATTALLPRTAPFGDDEIASLDRVLSIATPIQRAWLAGFLAGLDAAAQPAPAQPHARPAEPLTILFASESGNAERWRRTPRSSPARAASSRRSSISPTSPPPTCRRPAASS